MAKPTMECAEALAADDTSGMCCDISPGGDWYCDQPKGHRGPHGFDLDHVHLWAQDELTLRDRFAMAALQSERGGSYAHIAESAYAIADAMMAERRKREVIERREQDNAAKSSAKGHAAGIEFARHAIASPGADGFDDDDTMAAYCSDEAAIADDAIQSAHDAGYGPSIEHEDDPHAGGMVPGTDEYVGAFIRGVEETIGAHLAEKEGAK